MKRQDSDRNYDKTLDLVDHLIDQYNLLVDDVQNGSQILEDKEEAKSFASPKSLPESLAHMLYISARIAFAGKAPLLMIKEILLSLKSLNDKLIDCCKEPHFQLLDQLSADLIERMGNVESELKKYGPLFKQLEEMR